VQFGSDSADAIRAHSTALLRDLERLQHVAASTDFRAEHAVEPARTAGAGA
jgi:hypothetical protein